MKYQTFLSLCIGLEYLCGGCFCLYDESILLFTDSLSKGLFGVSSKTGMAYSVPVKRISNPIGIHYNEQNELIYWSDVILQEIRRTSVSGFDDVILRTLDNGSIPDGLAVDSVSSLLFYTDAGNHLIAIMELDGSNHAIVIDKDCDQPRTIVLDPMKGQIFWSDWGKFPKIETAKYDGTDRKAIVTTGLLWPNALAVDFIDQYMYWGDAGTHYIERSKLDGSGRKILFYDSNAHYFSMLTFSDTLFYTDWKQKSVMALPISGAENSTAVGNGSFARLNDLSRLKKKPMFPRTNACSKNKGSCSHICIPRPKGKFSCLCPTGFVLKDDTYCVKAHQGGTCQPLKPKNFTTITPKECLTHLSPVGMVCSVKCSDGFDYIGIKTELVCEKDGIWSDDVYECFDVRRPVIHNCPRNWQVLTAKRGQDTVTVEWPEIYATDNSGVKPDVYSTMKSGVTLHEGEYTVNLFAVDDAEHFMGCEFTFIVKVRRCGLIPIPDKGYIRRGWCPNYYGARCEISCNIGNQFSPKTYAATIECDSDEYDNTVWTGNHLLCQPIECPQLPPLMTVQVFGCSPPYTVGSVCEQSCVEGSTQEIPGPSGIRVCKDDGTWSGIEKRCLKTDGISNNTPQPTRKTDNENGLKETSLLTAGLVIVVSLMLVNLGIFVHLRKLGTNIQTKTTSTSKEAAKEATETPVACS